MISFYNKLQIMYLFIMNCKCEIKLNRKLKKRVERCNMCVYVCTYFHGTFLFDNVEKKMLNNIIM